MMVSRLWPDNIRQICEPDMIFPFQKVRTKSLVRVHSIKRHAFGNEIVLEILNPDLIQRQQQATEIPAQNG